MIEIVREGSPIDAVISGCADVVLFSVGLDCSTNRGFVHELSVNYPDIVGMLSSQGYCDRRNMGRIAYAEIGGVYLTACFIHNGGYRKSHDGSFADYGAIESVLSKVDAEFEGKRIHTYLLGTDETDGLCDRERVLSAFRVRCLRNAYTVYDMPHRDLKLECFRRIAELRRLVCEGALSSDEYVRLRSKVEWERRFGKVSEMPEGYSYRPSRGNRKRK